MGGPLQGDASAAAGAAGKDNHEIKPHFKVLRIKGSLKPIRGHAGQNAQRYTYVLCTRIIHTYPHI